MPDPSRSPQKIDERRTAEIAAKIGGESGSGITFRRLQIFWAVALFNNLTKASKQLGLTQPTLSQQIASLEETVGTPLFYRRSNRMFPTEAGTHLLRMAEQVLESMQQLEDGLAEISDGTRQTVHLAGLNSVLRVLLPPAMNKVHEAYPKIDYDIHESAPAEVLELLYGRRISLGLIAANSIAPASAGFLQVPIYDDPYVLAAPACLELEGVTDPLTDLSPEALAILNRSIQFAFGTPYAKRVQAWYDEVIPGNWPFAKARSFEVALGMVRAKLGVCLAPTLSCVVGAQVIDGVKLYRVNFPPRRLVALMPTHYARQQPYATLVEALQQVASSHVLPPVLETPPFLCGTAAPPGRGKGAAVAISRTGD